MKSPAGIKSRSILLALRILSCLLIPGLAASQEPPKVQLPAGAQVKLLVDMSADELRQSYPSAFSDLIFDSNQDGLEE
jgi:hypothetical protein